jgi:hypothetical protein
MIKWDSNSHLKRYKAKLVAKGFTHNMALITNRLFH